MLALFLNHPPLFVAGEIALGLSLALFVGALIAAVVRRASEISQLREAGHPEATIVRGLWAKRPTLVQILRLALATRPVVRSRPDPRCARKRQPLRQRGPDTQS